ncbi:MAG: SDR family oxidoreductase [Firmicutes bacterium]|nr:SDR family oxidoreductase [Bacillota bacterium]
MATFLTGATGYIGAHIAANLLSHHGEPLNLLVRARDDREAAERLWRALQLHMEFAPFYDHLRARISIFRGDLTEKNFGLAGDDYRRLVETTDSVLHCAASLNRKSEKSCLNTNLRGTLEVIQLARRAQQHHGLRRFSHVSTVAVAGVRRHEVVTEDTAVDWNRSDYDPYARTKKFAEHMIRTLLADVPLTIFRPSIVLGDSRWGATTQFDMVRAFAFLASLPVLPFRATDRVDIVNVDFVADAVTGLHTKDRPQHDTYHLSSGRDSQTYRELTEALARSGVARRPLFVPALEAPFRVVTDGLARRGGALGYGASLMKVFLPYLVWNTVFDNTRVTAELGRRPAPFSSYCVPLLRFAREHRFQYPYRPWPESVAVSAAVHGAGQRVGP